MMFLNLGSKWLCTDVPRLHGTILLPSGNNVERLMRTNLPNASNMLFDPQLYLCGTDVEQDPKLCAKLSSFSWFRSNVDALDSSAMNRREWERHVLNQVGSCWTGEVPSSEHVSACVQEAVDFQVNLGFSRIILPSPLITEREGEALVQLEWLQSGLEVISNDEPGQPVWFTVAVSEEALADLAFGPNGLLDSIVDQISAQPGIDGVYIVVAQTYCGHPFASSREVIRAYAHLSHGFRLTGIEEVCCNFCDTFGLACLSLGATSFATGPSQSTRRICLEAPKGGGFALPNFFSHPSIGEYRTERDLDEVVAAGVLDSVACRTPYSETLIDTLESGGSAADLPEWAESPNKVATAQSHFLAALAAEARTLFRSPLNRRRARIRNWIESAIEARDRVQGSTSDRCKPTFPDLEEWLSVVTEYSN